MNPLPFCLKHARTGAFLVLFSLNLPSPSAHAFATPQQSSNDDDSVRGIHKIKHVIVIMQENRSFDTYFGTYPRADGIPMKDGSPTVCVPDPQTSQCVYPFHNQQDKNGGGPHGASNATADVKKGKMDGFIAQAEAGEQGCVDPNNPACSNGQPDVMGYHDWREIPNYWTYAALFVLQDHMFEPNASWSLPEHLFQWSEWSANVRSTMIPVVARTNCRIRGFPQTSRRDNRKQSRSTPGRI